MGPFMCAEVDHRGSVAESGFSENSLESLIPVMKQALGCPFQERN